MVGKKGGKKRVQAILKGLTRWQDGPGAWDGAHALGGGERAVVLAREYEVDCSAVENLLGRLKMLLLLNVKQEEAHVEGESRSENVDHLGGNQNVSKLFEQLARNTFGPPLGATSQQSSKIIKSKFR